MTFKKKLENYWYYYKIHTIVGLFVSIILVTSIVQCAKNVEFDMQLAHVGTSYISTDQIQQSLKNIVPDVNGDGNIAVYLDSIIIPDKPTSEADFYMSQKLAITFVDGSTRIYIMEKDFFANEMYSDMFQPLEGIIDKKYLDNSLKYNGMPIALSTLDCPFLVENNMAKENLYVGILAITDSVKNKKNINEIYKASENILKEFIK